MSAHTLVLDLAIKTSAEIVDYVKEFVKQSSYQLFFPILYFKNAFNKRIENTP
jgi:hypothetical protein